MIKLDPVSISLKANHNTKFIFCIVLTFQNDLTTDSKKHFCMFDKIAKVFNEVYMNSKLLSTCNPKTCISINSEFFTIDMKYDNFVY